MLQKARLPWAAVLILLVISAGIALLAITGHRTYPPLPSPNGYDDFVKAGRSIAGEVRGSANLDKEALRGVVVSNTEPLRLLRHGLSCQCSFPTAVGITNISGAMSDLSNLRNLALLLRAQGQLAELDGRPAEAATNYIEILRFADQTSHGGFILNLMVTIACEAIGEIPLAKLIPSLECEQTRPLLSELDQLDRNRVNFDEIRRNEKRLMVHELLNNHNLLQWPTVWLQVQQILPHAQKRYNTGVARERLLMLELALRCFKSNNAAAPSRLDELVPGYTSRIPQDPFSGRPFVYKGQGANWLLYSIGPDGIDDGGKPVTSGSLNTKGDLFYNSPW